MAGFWYRTFPRLMHLKQRIWRANYEREMELLDVLCDRTRTGVDIGAKVGMYTYRIRARSSDVLAFEPIPLFNTMLKAVFDGRRGRIEPFAVSNVRGRAVLRLPFDHDGSRQFGRSTIDPGNSLVHHQIARTEELEVETRTLDEYALPGVGFIKIDVEGHEVAVLDGAAATIAAHLPNLLVECNDAHQPDGVVKLATWFREHDYEGLFMEGNVLHPIETYTRAVHWDQRGIENFIGVHRSRNDVRARLERRVAARDPRVIAHKLAHQ
jgi:FkbM family methyltransferase